MFVFTVCFVETKTDDIDIISLPGYKFVMKNRTKITKNRSGGIMVGFKDNLAKHIDIVNTEYSCCSSLKASSDEYLVYTKKYGLIVLKSCSLHLNHITYLLSVLTMSICFAKLSLKPTMIPPERFLFRL
jgi:hypothetical protein